MQAEGWQMDGNRRSVRCQRTGCRIQASVTASSAYGAPSCHSLYPYLYFCLSRFLSFSPSPGQPCFPYHLSNHPSWTARIRFSTTRPAPPCCCPSPVRVYGFRPCCCPCRATAAGRCSVVLAWMPAGPLRGTERGRGREVSRAAPGPESATRNAPSGQPQAPWAPGSWAQRRRCRG